MEEENESPHFFGGDITGYNNHHKVSGGSS